MTNGSPSNQDYWASIRPRERANGDISYAVLYRLDGGQRTLTFRDEAVADAFQATVKAHGIHKALAMNGYEVRTESEAAAPYRGAVDAPVYR